MYVCGSTVEPEPGLDGLKCSLRKFVHDTELKQWSLLESNTATERDLGKLEAWEKRG